MGGLALFPQDLLLPSVSYLSPPRLSPSGAHIFVTTGTRHSQPRLQY